MQYLTCLAYVPIDSVVDVLDNFVLVKVAEIMDRVTEEDDEQEDSDEKLLNTALKKYLRYFLPTYVGTMDTVTNKRVKPRIDMSLWNKYEAVTEGAEDLTNNVAENFNSVSKVDHLFIIIFLIYYVFRGACL